MLFSFFKIPAKLAFLIYCRHLNTNNKYAFKHKGPLLIAASHPNSFLDAVLLATLFKQPIYSLARGDVFANKWIAATFKSLNILPVYRISEGANNLEHNYTTFDACRKIFERNGIVLIFSEGLCVNEWHLRKLKKGTARLAFSAWDQDIPLKVLPIGINYQSFDVFGKNIIMNFGKIITKDDFTNYAGYGNKINLFNETLHNSLKELVIEIDETDLAKRKNNFYVTQPILKKIILFLPALLGYLLHFPLYFPIQQIMKKVFNNNVHFDSMAIGCTFFLYPFYLILISLFTYSWLGNYWWVSVFFIVPFLGWSFVQLKRQF